MSVNDLLAVLNEENGFFERLLFSPQFESIAKSYGFGSDDDYPDWIKDALNCVVEKKHCKKYFDERDEVYNLFEHLLSDFNWPIENEGEWTLLVFPNSEMKLYISRDALNPQTGRGCSSWETESI